MKVQMKKSSIFAFALCLLFCTMVVLAGCSDGGSNGNGGNSGKASGLPISIKSNGNTYTITDVAVTTNDSGNTVISCKGSGFNILSMKNNKMIIPVYCSVVSDGKETQFKTFSTSSDGADFIFATKLSPTKVIFYPEDSKSSRSEVKLG